MKKLILLLALLFPAAAHAAPEGAVWEKGYSTFTVTAVNCTTGTVMELTATRRVPGFTPALYEVYSTSGTVYVGNTTNVTNNTATAAAMVHTGWPIAVNTSAQFPVSQNPTLTDQPPVRLFCIANDLGGPGGLAVPVILRVFGYK